MRRWRYFLFASAVYLNVQLQAQALLFRSSADSSFWLRATGAIQAWARYTDHNPGSALNFGGPTFYTAPRHFDLGIRRARFQLFGALSKRAFFYAQFGINNFNAISARKTGAFFHDLTAEYVLVPGKLNSGAGLTGWSGLSRYASPAIASTLMYDAPLFQQTTNDVSDQFLRKLSIFAKGKLWKLDYRAALSKPMSLQTSLPPADTTLAQTNRAGFSPAPPELQYQAYFVWQFLSQEENHLPYTTGSYLGTKDVLNIGSGIVHQERAMRHRLPSGEILHRPMTLLAIDVFYDHIINAGKRTALTVYCGFFNMDFGPNHIRPLGVMNPVNASVNAAVNRYSGSGNSFPMYGTGQVLYLQGGYKLREKFFGEMGTLQPYADIFYASYQSLDNPVIVWNGGVNWLIKDHNSKVSLNYQERPVFEEDPVTFRGREVRSARRAMVVLQYQVFF